MLGRKKAAVLSSPLLGEEDEQQRFSVISTLQEELQLERKYDDGTLRRVSVELQIGSGTAEEICAPAGTVLTCMIDQEKFVVDGDTPHFFCPQNPSHSMCAQCFADYVNFCCESWATQNTIPIKCQMPDCDFFIPELTIRRLLASLENPRHMNLSRRYSQVQLKVALSAAPGDATDIPITCAFCGIYSEFYIKAAPDYWEKQSTQVKKAQVEKERRLVEVQRKIREEIEAILQDDEKSLSLTPQQISNRRIQLESDLEGKKIKMIQEVCKDLGLGSINGNEDEVVETSLFFICKNLFCDGAYCLSCKTFFKKSNLANHSCDNSSLEDLYRKVMETLANAATRACPVCGTSGMKDLACTHITCDKCFSKFCYVCGGAEYEMRGGFEEHNKWHNDPLEMNKCPLYLHYKWGVEDNAESALENFHRELQVRALDALKREINNDMLWSDLMEKKFDNMRLVDPPIVKQGYFEGDLDLLALQPQNQAGHQPQHQQQQVIHPAAAVSDEDLETFIARKLDSITVYLRQRSSWLLPVCAGFVVSYILFYLFMYGLLIYEGKMAMDQTCSEELLPRFALLHGAFGWVAVFLAVTHRIIRTLRGGNEDDEYDMSLILLKITKAGFSLLLLSMTGTFGIGAAMFYKTSSQSCFSPLWNCVHVFFSSTWITITPFVFFSFCLWRLTA